MNDDPRLPIGLAFSTLPEQTTRLSKNEARNTFIDPSSSVLLVVEPCMRKSCFKQPDKEIVAVIYVVGYNIPIKEHYCCVSEELKLS